MTHPPAVPPNPRPLPARLAALESLLAAEAAAEAGPAGVETRDLEQAVWLRLLESDGPPAASPARWLRDAVRAEVRSFRRQARREVPYDGGAGGEEDGPGRAAAAPSAEREALAAEGRRALLTAVRRLPGRCPQLLSALLSRSDPTYQDISRELGISQGSLGPLRSRCLGCLRALLRPEVEPPQLRGTEG